MRKTYYTFIVLCFFPLFSSGDTTSIAFHFTDEKIFSSIDTSEMDTLLLHKFIFHKILIDSKDIVSFNWEKQRILLSDESIKRFEYLNIPLNGIPIQLKVNNRLIYSALIWNLLSSLGHSGITLTHIPKSRYLFISLDFPSKEKVKNDQRFNTDLMKALKILEKLE